MDLDCNIVMDMWICGYGYVFVGIVPTFSMSVFSLGSIYSIFDNS